MTTINNYNGGTVVVSEDVTKPRWKHTMSIFGRWYLTISNCRVKNRTKSGKRTGNTRNGIKELKHLYYDQQNGCCKMCGERFDIAYMEMHHILPHSKFPELRKDANNLVMLCHDCHNEVHNNPFINVRMMEAKAKELGINLQERYEEKTEPGTIRECQDALEGFAEV